MIGVDELTVRGAGDRLVLVLVGAVNFIRESIAAGKPPRSEDLESLDYARDDRLIKRNKK